ncbi:hypothetical protein WCD74_22765 [Actinomycetospora sp. OC33-EN08]|uniref:Uncharacterized protein n=1 Tax=Actinomycetospora aurantiaca TaxID=3129233 RepID=A0ABU8MUL7_9PSEU
MTTAPRPTEDRRRISTVRGLVALGVLLAVYVVGVLSNLQLLGL